MPAPRFDQYRLGPRFYRLEFERCVAMRCLALQQLPLPLADVGKEVVDAVAAAAHATIEYAADLEQALHRAAVGMAVVETMTSAVRLGQVAAQLEDLERKVQDLVRYGWAIQRAWNRHVVTPESVHRAGGGVFPDQYLGTLEPWPATLGMALARVRARAAKVHGVPADQAADQAADVTVDPTVWSTGYVLEKAKAERCKRRQSDARLDAVRGPSTTAVDVQGRTALHHAAVSADDVQWLRRFNLADVQALWQMGAGRRAPSLAALDVVGDSALTIAARAGNAAAVRYIVNDSGLDAAAVSLADAALVAFAAGHANSAGVIVERLAAFPEQAALVMRMAVFYGLAGLYDAVCAALDAAGARAYMSAEAALELSVRGAVGGSLLHLAALGGRVEMVRAALRQGPLRSAAPNAHARDAAGLTALDIANYFGFRACADELLAAAPPDDAPVPDGTLAESRALQPPGPAARPARPAMSAVFVTLGANDERRHAPPLTLDSDALRHALDAAGLPSSTHLLLRIELLEDEYGADTASDAYTADVSTLLDASSAHAASPTPGAQTWQPPALLYSVCPERAVLRLDLVALADHVLAPRSEPRLVARALVALPPTFLPAFSEREPGRFLPMCVTGASHLQAVFHAMATGDAIGEANLEAVVSTPFAGRPPGDACAHGRGGEWLRPGHTLIYGHRGSGMNCRPADRPGQLQLGENTALSMAQAVRDGAAAVEFDVQLTRDLVPVIYHDWIVAETGFETPVNALAQAQFMALNPRARPLRTRRSCADLVDPPAPPIWANSTETVQAPFATLRELFDGLPAGVGFDIEVKYPMPDEADSVGMSTSFEINLFVDRILDIVYGSAPRPVVFTSFHPDICLLLAHKVRGDYPVMLLTDAGMSAMADRRCNGIDVAVSLCKWAGLAGVVTHVGPIVQSPRVAALVRRRGLALATYGGLNNAPEHIRLQQAYGVDVVIADNVRGAVATVRRAQGVAPAASA